VSGAEQLETLQVAVDGLHDVVVSLDASEMDVMTNCEPWDVRRLASHALNNQLLWSGLVTGQAIVSPEDTMGAVAHDGDLATFADEVRDRALGLWSDPDVLAATHATPLGELPGSVVILFPTVDALAHAWDLSASVGRAIEFAPATVPAATAVFAATCTDHAREIGLIQPGTEPPPDATPTERLLATAGRVICRA
jgi:uncharacterized protein (TIGR03086 family)